MKPPTGQKRSGVKAPASYVPQQMVGSTANFPFSSKQPSARPHSQIETVPRDSNLDKIQRSVPTSTTVISYERQTQSPVSQQKLSQPNINLQSVNSQPVSNVNSDMPGITKDMYRLSVDSASLEQAKSMKQFSISQSSASSGFASDGSSITKSMSASSLQGTSTNKTTINSGSQPSGEGMPESAGSLGHAQVYQAGYQPPDITNAAFNVVQEGVYILLLLYGMGFKAS